MKILSLVLLAIIASPVYGFQWPELINTINTPCQDDGFLGTCSSNVWYYTDGTGYRDAVPAGTPLSSARKEVVTYGTHCSSGNPARGKPFTNCWWGSYMDGVSPRNDVGRCALTSLESWELDPKYTCPMINGAWGPKRGYGGGAACVVFAQVGQGERIPALWTIYGNLSAEVVANAGGSFCREPLPSGVTCDITLPSTIDHGVIDTNAHSVVTVDGNVACGGAPKISVFGGALSCWGRGCLPL